jgi:hypothetical protein
MVLELWVEPLTKPEDDVGTLKVACAMDHLAKIIDILINGPSLLEVF